jgi:hypothetical protein
MRIGWDELRFEPSRIPCPEALIQSYGEGSGLPEDGQQICSPRPTGPGPCG